MCNFTFCSSDIFLQHSDEANHEAECGHRRRVVTGLHRVGSDAILMLSESVCLEFILTVVVTSG